MPQGLKDPQAPVEDVIQKTASILWLLPSRKQVENEDYRGRRRSWWDLHALEAVDLCFSATCSQGVWFLDCFPLLFFSSDVAQTSKATIWILSDSNCKSVFFGCFPTLFCGFCFTVALSSTQFYIKMKASLSRALQKKSYEMIWATDDIQFVNSSTWLDFNFWTWIFEIYINIFFMFKFTIVA